MDHLDEKLGPGDGDAIAFVAMPPPGVASVTRADLVDFLLNEHFAVAVVETGGAIVYGSVRGDPFMRHEVYVLGPDQTGGDYASILGQVRRSVGSGRRPLRHARFPLAAAGGQLDPLDQLVSSLTTFFLHGSTIRHLRSLIRDSGPELRARSLARYEANGFLGDYERQWSRALPLPALELFLAELPTTATVLDAGCGPGHHSAYMASRGRRVLALDMAGASVAAAARRGAQLIGVCRADIAHLPVRALSIDGIWCCATLVHWPVSELHAPLAELRRVLSATGILGLSMSIGKLPAVDPDGRFFDSFVNYSELARTCAGAGFEIVRSLEASSPTTTSGGNQRAHWITVLARKLERG